jgi:hypothetical protein
LNDLSLDGESRAYKLRELFTGKVTLNKMNNKLLTWMKVLTGLTAISFASCNINAPAITPSTPGNVPVAPTQLSAAAGDQKVILSWKPVPGADRYTIKRAALTEAFADANTIVYTPIGEVTDTGYTDTTSSVGTDYIYVVSAKNAAGESSHSNSSCSAPAPSGTVTTGIRPRVFMAMHGSQALSGGSAEQDAQWAFIRTCLEGIYDNKANVTVEDQARLWRKISTRNLFGIKNSNGIANDPNPEIAPPALLAVEKQNPDLRLNRDATVVYSNDRSLWDNLTVDGLRSILATYPNQDASVPREAVWKDVFVGYDLRSWLDPTLGPDGALATPGAVNALASAGGTMVECIGGLCGSDGQFGKGFLDLLQRTHANGKPILMFISKSPKNTPQTGWFDEFKREYQKVSALGQWRSDDIVMIINYGGSYPALPMKNADGSAADTVTGMLYWALHQ